MPLGFDSRSHGTIAFGFFNIESDMLLLENLFFFADRFCMAATEVLTVPDSSPQIQAWRIVDRATVGNLHGAIAGEDLSGFIGACYARHPFPEDPDAFKQNPESAKTQQWMAETITDFGTPETVALVAQGERRDVAVAEYVFTADEFMQLIGYVIQGGYPRWKDERRPVYVDEMITELEHR